MRKGWWLVAALPGGAALIGGVWFAGLYAAARTGVVALDRWAIRGNACLALLMAWKLQATPAAAKAFVAGVLANEGAYEPNEYAPGGSYPLGDVGHALGPSVGPGQVLSGLHLRRLGYTGNPLDLALVGNELRALYYAATIYREAFEAVSAANPGQDYPTRLLHAVEHYNGSGPAAVAYRERATQRIATLGGLPA